MSIAFWGDLHIGRMSKTVNDDVGLSLHRRLIRRLLSATRRVKAKFVVILGDVFNSPFPTQDDLSMLIDELSRADDIEFVVLMGNHDIYDALNNSLKLLKRLPQAGALTNVRFVLKARQFYWGGVELLALPYGARPEGRITADLIVFHDAVVGAQRDNKTTFSIGEGVHPSVFGRVIAVGGHIHMAQRLGRIHFVGTQASLAFNETHPKRFYWLDTREMRMCSTSFEPPWQLEQSDWSNDDPPRCNAPDTYYQLHIKDERPGPRWLINHPQVIDTRGGSKTVKQKAASKIVKLLEGGSIGNENDDQMLKRFLKAHSPLDQLSVMKAVRIHTKLAGS